MQQPNAVEHERGFAIGGAAPGGRSGVAPEPPRHVAIIMDGNGRWAKARGLPRVAGHRRGAETVREIVEACGDLGVEALTLFAFSTENWRRPRTEVSGLMDLFRSYFRREAERLAANGVRVRFLGRSDRLPDDIQSMMRDIEERTAANARLTLAIAINYGARDELVRAAQRLAELAAGGAIDPADIDEEAFAAGLDTVDLPDPDLLIRTSGEQRLSNFLLWQAAYAELVFAEETWPEFSRASLERAIGAYHARDRRYGGLAGLRADVAPVGGA